MVISGFVNANPRGWAGIHNVPYDIFMMSVIDTKARLKIHVYCSNKAHIQHTIIAQRLKVVL
jgi:hypothetical protein